MIVMILPLLAIEVDGEFSCCFLVGCYLPQRIRVVVVENLFVVNFASIGLDHKLLLVHSCVMVMVLESLLESIQI
jgi:hypothetical protein